MKIYFAGSIRGGREDEALYREWIDYIRGFGEVLTEHVADPEITERGQENLSDREIFERDLEWLEESDVLIAEATTPSLGVGYEIAVAEDMGKPVLCLFRPGPGKKLSAMIAGNPAVTVKTYHNIDEAREIIRGFIG